jgi:hypothetical protein
VLLGDESPESISIFKVFYIFRYLVSNEIYMNSEWLLVDVKKFSACYILFYFKLNFSVPPYYHRQCYLINTAIYVLTDWSHFSRSNVFALQNIVVAHWNNNSLVDMSLHWDTLSWFCVNQSLSLLFNDAYLAIKQEIPFL